MVGALSFRALFPLAHSGHWLPDLLIYGGPVVIGLVAIKWVDRRERRAADADSS